LASGADHTTSTTPSQPSSFQNKKKVEDVKLKMPLSLRPVTYPNGLVRWDRSALILHFFWAWQFLQACFMEAAQMLSLGTAGLAGAPVNYGEYVFPFTNF
jgi:hypothetical protein